MQSAALANPMAATAMWTSTTIMVLAYGIIITEKINRAIVALIGGAIMIIIGLISQDEAIRGVDFNTIGLLTGMMVLVNIARRTGMFEYVAVAAVRTAGGEPAAVLALLAIGTAAVSALLDNVTTVLLIVPVTLAVVKTLRVPAFPFLFSEVLASNIGGTATLIGDPPNILIGSRAGIPFNDFIVNLAPIALIILIIQIGIGHWLWGRHMRADQDARKVLLATNPADSIRDVKLLKRALLVLGCVLIGFLIAHEAGLQPATIAMLGAACLLLLYCFGAGPEVQTERTHHILSEVEWITIFFFIGLFIIVHGVEAGGLLDLVAHKVVELTGGNLAASTILILWVSALLSSIVDNIPFVATMIPVIKSMAVSFGGDQAIMPLWWALALGACLGGNGTLIGASANLIVAGIAEREGERFSFLKFTAYAFPMMLVSIAVSHVYLWLRYL